MKKKILTLLLVLASVIACMFCVSACNGGGADRSDFIGKWECISVRVVMNTEGEEGTVVNYIPGESGIPEDYCTLELNEDGSFTMTTKVQTNAPAITVNGTWSVNDGYLSMETENGKNDGYTNATIVDGVLTLSSKFESPSIGLQEQEIKLRKVVEDNTAE